MLRGHRGGLVDAAVSPDATLVVTVSDDGTAALWSADPTDAGCAQALRAGGPAHGIRFEGPHPAELLRRAGGLLRDRAAWASLDPQHHDVL